ncbi:MAG: Zn-dependent hydrolase [Bacillales bacterium]|nr:Zn-dependent hydrolase [Bacillales bacterium]
MIKKEIDNIKVIPLGGAGEVGKNLYVINIDEEIFIVDAGLKFPESEMYGIDKVIPDITYLVENKDKIKAVFITHGHEDHIGALAYVLKKINVPIYATRLTIGLIKDLLSDEGFNLKTLNLKTINPDVKIKFENTSVSFFRTTHNIPDSIGISFQTSIGSVVYTGDFKFDYSPVDGIGPDINKMSYIGNQGVLCLISDSTNAEKPGFTPSESVVGVALNNEFYKAKGRLIVATFSSNIHRIQQVVNAAANNNRKVVFVGHCMQRAVTISKELGYLKIPKNTSIQMSEVDKYSDNELVFLTTGNQGEPLSAVSKIAKQVHKGIVARAGDTLIIASTPVPGNEILVYKSINLLLRLGVNVIYNEKQIHVSGHGSQEELKLMLQLMKPKYFIPVHGDLKMQIAHAKLAENIGIERDKIFLLDNGDVVHFTKDSVNNVKKVQSGNILIDGLGIGDIGNIVLRDRRLLAHDGILVVVITLNKLTKKVVSGPEIISRGFIYVRESEKLLEQTTEIVNKLVTKSTSEGNFEWSFLKSNIRDSLNEFFYEKTKRKPMILPIIMEV